MHSTFAVSGDGIPLGIPRIGFDCPDGRADRSRPPEKRKSARLLRVAWISRFGPGMIGPSQTDGAFSRGRGTHRWLYRPLVNRESGSQAIISLMGLRVTSG